MPPVQKSSDEAYNEVRLRSRGIDEEILNEEGGRFPTRTLQNCSGWSLA